MITEPTIEYHDNGKIAAEIWTNGEGELHYDNNWFYAPVAIMPMYPFLLRTKWIKIDFADPAIIEYYSNGQIKHIGYYQNGVNGRSYLEDYASQWYYPNGTIKRTEWRFLGDLHSVYHNPSVIEYYPNGWVKTEEWHQRGDMQWQGRPVRIEYYPNGQKHFEVWRVHNYREKRYIEGVVIYNDDGAVIYDSH